MKQPLPVRALCACIVCIFLSYSATAQLPSYLPADGLVGWWPFNGNANDESGNGHDGVVNGATLTNDRFGSQDFAYSFDGINDHIQVNADSSITGFYNFSISLWFKPNSFPNYDLSAILSKWAFPTDCGYQGEDYGIWLTTDGHAIGGTKVNTQSNTMPWFNATIGQWQQLVFVHDALNGSRIYRDGLLSNVSSQNGSLCYLFNNLIIGAGDVLPFAGTRQFSGTIDDIAIYNRALSETEIQNLYTGQPAVVANTCSLPSNLQQGLVGYWPFCGNANDESGNGNNGVVNGAALTEDRFGNALSAYSFDGIDDNILTSFNGISGTNSRSISFWFLTNTIAQDELVFTDYGGNGCGSGFATTLFPQNKIGVDNTCSFQFSNNASMNGVWYFYTVTYSGLTDNISDCKLYLNGILQNSTVIYSDYLINTILNANMTFGSSRYFSFNQYLNGKIDDIAIWNRALTPEEISTLYTSTSTSGGGGNGGTGSLVGNIPPGIPYQAEVRNEIGEVLANANVNVRFTLHESAANGTVSYQETHTLATNELGLFATTIGGGTATQSTFAGINWAQTIKFLQVEVDAGNGYITMGNQQLLSVPYAQYAQKARKLETQGLPVFENNTQALAGGLQAGALYRTSLGDLKVVY